MSEYSVGKKSLLDIKQKYNSNYVERESTKVRITQK